MDHPNSAARPPVLVIDDEHDIRDMLAFGLGSKGYTVVAAASGEEGIEKTRTQAFAVIVCDIMMPGISGIETLKEIKKFQPDTEVIMATCCSTLETAVEAMRNGAFDYVLKPYTLEQLFLVINKAVESRALKLEVVRLEEANRVKSEFLVQKGTELRGPGQEVLADISQLREKAYGPLTLPQTQVLQRMQTHIRTILQTIRAIEDFARTKDAAG